VFTRGIVFFCLVGVTPGLFAQQMENFEVLWQVQSFHGDTEAFGIALAGGDLNGDGYVDLVIGSSTHYVGNYNGAAYIFWGPEYSSLTIIHNPTQVNSYFGQSLDIGDFNGDNFADLLIGDASFSPDTYPWPPYSGRVYLYYGGPQFDTIPDMIFGPIPYAVAFGQKVANIGDVNGDGFQDIGIGSPLWPGYPIRGKVYIYFGGPALDTIPDVQLVGFPDEQNFGLEIGGGEDVNGDGYDDVLVASWGPGWPPQGRIFVFFGGNPMDSLWDFTVASRWGRFMGVDGGVVALKNFTHWGYADVAAAAHGNEDTVVIFRGEPRIKPNPVAKLEESQPYSSDYGYDLAPLQTLNFSSLLVSDTYYRLQGTQRGCVYLYIGHPSYFDSTYDAIFIGEPGGSEGNRVGASVAQIPDLTNDSINEVLTSSYYVVNYIKQAWLLTYTGTLVDESPNPPSLPLRVSVYPTVAKDYVNIVFSGMRQGPVEIFVYDAAGRRIYTARKEVMSHAGTMRWDLVDRWGHRVPNGIYFLNILSGNRKVAMERVMVIKR